MQETLYNVASTVGVGAYAMSAYYAYHNYATEDPHVQMTVFGLISDLCLWLRMPLMLTGKATLREVYMFLGYLVVETVATSFNLLAFRERSAWFVPAALTVAVLGTVLFVLLFRNMLRLRAKAA